MHELSIAQSIVEIVQQHLPPGEIRGVKSVKVKVGNLAGILPELLQLAFDLASERTAVRGAKLDIEEVPIVCQCKKCCAEFRTGRYVLICPSCGAANVEIISGDELNVIEVELIE